MQLRQYQTELIQRVSHSWRTGHKAPCIVLPCGGGKSVIVAEIAKRTTLNWKQVLFLVHRKELCEQIFRTFSWWGVDLSLCEVMMVQTASRRLEKLRTPGTNINIQVKNFKYFQLEFHDDLETQKIIANLLSSIEKEIDSEESNIQATKNLKSFLVGNMFC